MQKNRNLLALILFLMSLGSSMYGIFLPIYFLKLGVPYADVIILLLAYSIGGVISGVFANAVIHRTGIKFFILLRGIVEPAVILLFRFYPQHPFSLPAVGLVYGFCAFSFWVSMDVFTVKSTDTGSRGGQTGKIYSALWIASIIAPFIGGALISYFGYPVMFMFSVAFILAGGIASFFIKIQAFSSKKLNLLPTLRGNIGKIMAATFIRGMSYSIVSYFMGIFIYEIFSSEIIVGSFGLGFGIAGLLATVLSSYLIDRFDRTLLLAAIYALMGVFWILLALPFATFILSAVILAVSFTYNAISIPLNTVFFNAIEKEDAITLSSERTIAVCLGQVPLLVLALFLSFRSLFLIAAVSCFAALPLLRRMKS